MMKAIASCILLVLACNAAKLPGGDDSAATVVKETVEAHGGDGIYKHSIELSNGIKIEAAGRTIPVAKEFGAAESGSFSYTAPDGQAITLTYKADENGFQPQGAHLPVAPPAPEYVAKLIAAAASQRKA